MKYATIHYDNDSCIQEIVMENLDNTYVYYPKMIVSSDTKIEICVIHRSE